MAIYGTALLAICLLIGLAIGKLFGLLIGVDANVGGVGIAMLLLILLSDRMRQRGNLEVPSQQGILFWSAVYIPIVVAMAASQNVLAAMTAGPVAICAGCLSVLMCFALVPLIARIGRDSDDQQSPENGVDNGVS